MKKDNVQPPKFAGAIIKIMLPPEVRAGGIQDFEYTFQSISEEKGRFSARCWFWFQILLMMPSILIEKVSRTISMFKNYLKIAFRNIRRNKTYSALNICGFAAGIAAYILIGLYINYELSYDEQHENADNIYQIFTHHAATTPAPVAPTLMREFSEIVSATRMEDDSGFLIRYGDKTFVEENWVWADKHLFDVFTFPLVMGDKSTALEEPFTVVITEKMAEKYFGDKNPVNEVFNCTFDDGVVKEFTVTGVLKNIPGNSFIKGDFFAALETMKRLGDDLESWGMWNFDTFFLLNENSDPEAFEEKYTAALEARFDRENEIGFYSKRLTDLHLRANGVRHLFGEVNDIKYIYLFSVIAFCILLMACINYLNLSTARSTQRSKEVGVRKASGARQSQLISQFLTESLLLTALSMILAFSMVYLLFPVFNDLVNTEGTIGLFSDMSFFVILIISVLAVGLLSGFYPALFMSKFNPASTLRGPFIPRTKGISLRNVLVVIQFSISIVLMIGTMVTSDQVDYLRSKKLGYSKDQIVIVPMKDSAVYEQKQAVKDELLQQAGITNISFSTAIPLKIDWMNNYSYNNPEDPENNRITTYYSRVDYDYLDLFEMEMVKGRKFVRELDDGNNAYIINEAQCRKLGWEDPIGREYGNPWRMGTVVGVVNDFHSGSMRSSIGPITLVLIPDAGHLMSIKLNTNNIQETLTSIEEVWDRLSSGYPFEFEFMDKQYDALYKTEIRRGKSFNYFSILAIFICCLGLFGMASFTIEQSIKMIGIRKVLGASSFALVKMLLWKFLKWTVLANIVAFPAAYFIMNSWLQEYAYRINLEWGTFILAGIFAALIAFLTVITLTIKATRANPVDSLRYE